MNRRSILKLFGSTPVTLPLAAKELQDNMIGDLVKIKDPHGLRGDSTPDPIGDNDIEKEQIRRALKIPGMRRQLESFIYEEERYVYTLDIDLANKRSFSMAAKIAFQRQRNVERRMKDQENPIPYYKRLQELVKNLLG